MVPYLFPHAQEMSCVTVIILIFLGDKCFPTHWVQHHRHLLLLIFLILSNIYWSLIKISLLLLMALKRYVGHREYFPSDIFLIQEISIWGELPIFSWTFIPYCWTKILNISRFFHSFCFSSFRPFLLQLLILKPLEASRSNSAEKWTFKTS